MDRELRDWLRELSDPPELHATIDQRELGLSDAAADYLASVAPGGTLTAALGEPTATEPELAG